MRRAEGEEGFTLFEDRADAGRRLAGRLSHYADEGPVVFALPRGGVPVGAEVSRSLGAPLEIIVARKLGAPEQPEFGIGAVAPGGARILNERAVRALEIGEDYLEHVTAKETAEAERRLRLFRGDRPYPDLTGRAAILVDDGLATGVTARAAIQALSRMEPGRLVLAVPVCAPQTAELLRPTVDDLVALLTPPDMEAVGLWYKNFRQVPDEEVMRLIAEAQGPPTPETGEDSAAAER